MAELASWDEVFTSVEEAKVGLEPEPKKPYTGPKRGLPGGEPKAPPAKASDTPASWDEVFSAVKEVESGFDPEYLKELKTAETVAQLGAATAPLGVGEWATAAKIAPEHRRAALERSAELYKERGPMKDAGTAKRAAVAIAQGGVDMAMPVAQFFAPEELQLTGEQEAFRQALIATREGNDPSLSEGWIASTVQQAARMAPPMLMMGAAGRAAGAVGKSAGLGATGTAIAQAGGVAASAYPMAQDQSYRSLIAEGIDPGIAAPISRVSGGLEGIIETLIPDPFKVQAGVLKGTIRQIVTQAIGRLGVQAGRIGLESTEEGAQAFTREAVAEIARAVDEEIPNQGLGPAFAAAGEDFLNSLGPLSVIMGPSMAIGAVGTARNTLARPGQYQAALEKRDYEQYRRELAKASPAGLPPAATNEQPDTTVSQSIASLDKPPGAHKWAEIVLGDRKRFKEAPDEETRTKQWEQSRVAATEDATEPELPPGVADLFERMKGMSPQKPPTEDNTVPVTKPPLPQGATNEIQVQPNEEIPVQGQGKPKARIEGKQETGVQGEQTAQGDAGTEVQVEPPTAEEIQKALDAVGRIESKENPSKRDVDEVFKAREFLFKNGYSTESIGQALADRNTDAAKPPVTPAPEQKPPVSERDKAEDELAGLLGEEEKAPEKPAQAEPWQLTPSEYVSGETDSDIVATRKAAHPQAVKRALEQGKQVPRVVLDAYANNTWAKKAIEQLYPSTAVPSEEVGQKEMSTIVDKQNNNSAQPSKSSEVDSKPGSQPEGVGSSALATRGADLPASEQARANIRKRGKKKPSQAELDAEAAAVIREREADNQVRQEFKADRDAQKAQEARREFVGKQKALANPATVDSLGFGDIAQVNDDIERGRVSYEDATKVADGFVAAGYLPQGKRDQIRKPTPASADQVNVDSGEESKVKPEANKPAKLGRKGATKKPSPEPTGESNWRKEFDAESDPYKKTQLLRQLANMQSNPQELSDILDRVTDLEDETNIRWAVGLNPAATEEVISRAESEGAGVMSADGKIPRRGQSGEQLGNKSAKPEMSTIVDKPEVGGAKPDNVESTAEEKEKVKAAGIKIKQTKKGWSVTGLPNTLSQEMQDGIRAEGGRKIASGYFFKGDPTSRLAPTAEAITNANRESDKAAKAGLVSTPIGVLSQEDADWYTREKQQRLELAKQMLSEANAAVDELLSNFVSKAKRGLFNISLKRANETSDQDAIPQFDEMVEYSVSHPELGLPQDEQGLFERLQQSVIQDETLAQRIDDELAAQLASDEGNDSFDFGEPSELAQPRQTAIEGLEEEVARQERKDIYEAKRAKLNEKLGAESSKGKQRTFLTDIYGDPDQGTLFDTDGIADEQPAEQPKTKLGKAAEKANKELASAVDEFGNVIKGKLGMNLPLNPEVIAAAAKVVAKTLEAGVRNFAVLMERMVLKYGEKMAARMEAALQQEWDRQVNAYPVDEDGAPPESPQPHPELVQPGPIPLTSVKNAIVDELRVQRGEAPMAEVTPETVQQWLELAGNRIANDPYAGNTLVEQLITGGKTSVDEIEGMVLQYHYRAVNNLFEAADAKLTEAKANGDPAEIAIAQDEARVIMRRLAAIETALDKAGTAWGRAGVSRQIFLKQDFSLGSMVRRARVANGGNELSDEQVAVISEQAKRIEELQKQLAEVEAKAESLAKQEQARVIDDGIKKDVESTKKPTVKPKSKMRLNAEARVASAWEKVDAVLKGKFYSNPVDLELLQPAMELAKAYYDLGIVTFREFMSSVSKNMGAYDKKAAEPTFRAAWDQLVADGEITQPSLDITNAGQLTRFAKQVQRTMVESGITEREEVVDAVHEALQEIIPEITRRQTMDALSSYGQFAQLSKDPIDQIIRDINGQLQQLSKLEDMEKGQAPAKTGVERRSPTDEERRLTQLVNEAKRRGGFVVTDPETQLKSAMAAAKTAVKNRIADMNYELKTGSRVVRNKTELIPDAELEQLRKDRDELQKVHKEMFPPKGATEAQKIASANRALDAAIASLEAKLAAGDISPAPQSKPLSTPEIDAKRAKLKQLHEQRDALRKIANPNMTDEQKKVRSLDRSIEALEKQLATGDFSPKSKPVPLTSPEIDARQAKLEELRATKKAILDAANPKMTPEQRASRAYEAHLRKQLAMYLEKIAQGDFAPKEKKQPRVLTKGELDLKKQLADVKHDFFEALSKYHLENLSPGERAIDIVRESAHLSRAIMTSIDLSAVLRQGGLGVYSHPAMARKAAAEMWRALWSREKEFQSMEQLRARPNAQLYEESGLNITDSEGKLTRQEEAFMGRWARTGIDFAGKKFQAASKLALEPVAASSRAYVTFINNLRADLFDVMVENLGPGGQVTKEEAKLIAKYVNVATGRADLKALNEAAATLNTVFFAPRYVASRFQYLAMPFYLMGTKDSGRVKKLIAKEYARTFTGATVFIGSLAALAYLAAGDDEEEKTSVEFNSLSSDFGKIKIGETRVDALAGLAQVIVFSSRMLAGHTKSSVTGKVKPFYEGGPYETTHGSEAWRFLRTKFAPVPGAVVTAFSGMKDVVGDPVTPAGLVGGLFVPISVGEVYSTMRHRGIPKGAALAVLNSLGAAVNTYGPKTAYLDATPEERAKQVNNYIKYMNWESDLPAFKQYLQPEDLKRVQDRQDKRRGDLIHDAMDKVLPKDEYKTEVHYEEAVEHHEKLSGQFEEFRKQYAPTYSDAIRYLTHHYDDDGGVNVKGTRNKKPGFIERRKRLSSYYESLTSEQ